MEDNRLNISLKEYIKVLRHKVGEGRDSMVFNAGKGVLYKIYKDESRLKDLDAPDTIYDKQKLIKKSAPSRNCYIDKDGTKIFYKDAIKRIVERQKQIKYSSLPKKALYVDGKFIGCVIDRKYAFQLHYVFPFLPRKTKIKVLKLILLKIKELTDNYIYPCDVANSPIVGNHSNILVDYKLEPQLIDLDGHSTLYRETYDEKAYNYVLFSTNLLLLELLHGNVYCEDMLDEEVDMLERILKEDGINDDLAHKLSRFNANFDELNELVLHYTNLK